MTTLWTQSNRSQRIFSLPLLLFSLFPLSFSLWAGLEGAELTVVIAVQPKPPSSPVRINQKSAPKWVRVGGAYPSEITCKHFSRIQSPPVLFLSLISADFVPCAWLRKRLHASNWLKKTKQTKNREHVWKLQRCRRSVGIEEMAN